MGSMLISLPVVDRLLLRQHQACLFSPFQPLSQRYCGRPVSLDVEILSATEIAQLQQAKRLLYV